MAAYACAMMSFGYCDYSTQSHFEALSRQNRYRASWSSRTIREETPESTISSAAPKSNNSKRRTWSPNTLARALTRTTDVTETTIPSSSNPNTEEELVGRQPALNRRVSWLRLSSSTSPSKPASSPSPPPAANTAQMSGNNCGKKDKARRRSLINGCIQRVKGFGKRNRHDTKNYRPLNDS